MAGHTRGPSGYISKIFFRYLKRFPKEIEFETTQDRTEPISVGSRDPYTKSPSSRRIRIPSSTIFPIHRARRDSCHGGRLRRRQHLLQPALAAGRSSSAAKARAQSGTQLHFSRGDRELAGDQRKAR